MITPNLVCAMWNVTLHEAPDERHVVSSRMGEEIFTCQEDARRRFRLRAWHRDTEMMPERSATKRKGSRHLDDIHKLIAAQWDISLHEAATGSFIISSCMGIEIFDRQEEAHQRFHLWAGRRDAEYWSSIEPLHS